MLVQDLSRDVRLAITQFKQRPIFVIGATLSLAIGMSLATAMFTVIETVVRTPLPFPDANRLAVVREQSADRTLTGIPGRLLAALSDGSTSFDDVAAAKSWGNVVGPSGSAHRMSA